MWRVLFDVTRKTRSIFTSRNQTTKIGRYFYTLDGQGGTFGVLAGRRVFLVRHPILAPAGNRSDQSQLTQISPNLFRFRGPTRTCTETPHGVNENPGNGCRVIFAREELDRRSRRE